MKFLRYLLFTLVILNFITEAFGKHRKTRKQPPGHVSQATRNYRHTHPEPSFNPLPQTYWTGPRYNFPNHTPAKYKAYNSRLSNIHHYWDTTKVLADKVKNLH